VRERGIAQLRRNLPGGRHHAQVAVGQALERGDIAHQVERRAPHRQDQAQHLLVVPPLRADVCTRVAQHAVDGGEVAAVPGLEPVTQARHLAIARQGREWQRVEVVQHQLPARRDGDGAEAVRAQRRRGHLPELVARAVGDAVAGMAELLDLRGQRAGTDGAVVGAQAVERREPNGLAEALPVHHRVHVGAIEVEQLAVFHVGQRAHDERRDLGVLVVHVARELR
jgi:hypothetical protein